ncbi:MAG: hypothetical protein ACOYJ6_20375, partial [Caulobacterales bacterium]
HRLAAVGLLRVPRRAAAPAASRPYRAAIPDADFAESRRRPAYPDIAAADAALACVACGMLGEIRQ